MNYSTETNVCFIANYSFTYLFHHIAETLAQENIKTHWIVNNKNLYDFLKSNYDESSILYISRDDFKATDVEPLDDYKLNELIYGDRVLRHEPQNGLNFLTNIQRPIYDFLKKHNTEMVMGELTWAHEVLIHRMCKRRTELNCTFLNPHVVRIPDNRFAFFTDERQSVLFEVNKEEYCDTPIEAKKPDYLKINDKTIKKGSSLAGRIKRASKFFTNENIEPLDPTLIVNQNKRFEICTREEINRVRYKSIERVPFDKDTTGPYIFLGLHKQPESTVDIFGRYYEDQLQNIKNIWRALPQGWKLLVKEHTNAIGDRTPDWYKTIQALPGVELVIETTNSYELIQNAELVATITGTVAYEAALMGVPSITFAPVFFNKVNTCRQITLEDLSNSSLDEIAADLKGQEDNRLKFSNYLLQNSFIGKFYDPQTTGISLSPENVEDVSAAVAFVINKLAKKGAKVELAEA